MIIALLPLIIILALLMPGLIGVAIIAVAIVWFCRHYRLEWRSRNYHR